MEKVVDLKKKK